MNIELVEALPEARSILKQLLELYCYEWSQYNKLDVNEKGSFEFANSDFWAKKDNFPFLIKVDQKWAGFVLVDKDFAMGKDCDFAISEFFVMYKYRTAGIGRYVAKEIFNKFHGKWEVMCHPKNEISIRFWKRVIDDYTKGNFEYIDECKEVVYQEGSYGTLFFFDS